jgi:hypothetical protein
MLHIDYTSVMKKKRVGNQPEKGDYLAERQRLAAQG